MTKTEFLSALRERLSGLPEEDLERSLDYYSEMIEDRIEEGFTESAAVNVLGDIETIASQIISEVPLKRLIHKKLASRKSVAIWKTVMIIFGLLTFGIPLIAVAFSLGVALYASIWAIAISLFAVPVALIGAGALGVVGFFALIISGGAAKGFLMLGMGLVSAGLALPFSYIAKWTLFGAVQATRGLILLIKKSLT